VDVLVAIAGGALQSLPSLLANMTAVLVAAIASTLAVSFFRGEATVFTGTYQLILFITGTLAPALGLLGGIAIVYRAHRRAEFDQRELGTLYTLLLFTLAYFIGLSPYVQDLL
jgi:cbb3-type cytochrome oxidase subunit 3